MRPDATCGTAVVLTSIATSTCPPITSVAIWPPPR
jgi:hypothetical protein